MSSKTYLKLNSEIYDLPADCSFTKASSWLTDERKSTDSSGTAQNITFLKRSGRQPQTFQIQFAFVAAHEDQNLFELLERYESLVGKQVELFYSGYPFGLCIVTDGSVALQVDYARGMAALTISYNLKETIIYTPTSSAVSVSFI